MAAATPDNLDATAQGGRLGTDRDTHNGSTCAVLSSTHRVCFSRAKRSSVGAPPTSMSGVYNCDITTTRRVRVRSLKYGQTRLTTRSYSRITRVLSLLCVVP